MAPIIKDWFAATDGAQGIQEGSKFGNSDISLKQTLNEMSAAAWNDSIGKGINPSGKLAEFIQQDGRFSKHDTDRLAAEAMDKFRQGATNRIDLDGTLRGGSRKYLAGRVGINHRSG
jgi:hypothetical protein